MPSALQPLAASAPTAESIREVAARNGLPVGRITQVSVLDPYSYGT
jgi:hypothetical protein